MGAILAAGLSACRQDMHDQPRKKPQSASAFFADGKTARNFVPGTIPHDATDDLHANDNRWLAEDEAFYTGKLDGKLVETFPLKVDAELLERGRNRFTVTCTPCHGRLGNGEGTAVARGMKQPPSYHIERLVKSPPGYFFDVMTNGFASMYDVADRVNPKDRWAIVAYIRALQLSETIKYDELSAQEKQLVVESTKKHEETAPHGAQEASHPK
ncbi:MAG: cytochrome c [Planctomycetes bacterium]|nr:cytochrome c [Planctomycetota bacterium]